MHKIYPKKETKQSKTRHWNKTKGNKNHNKTNKQNKKL